MAETVKIGDVTIVALSDQEQAYPASAVYPAVSEAQWAPYKQMLTAEGNVLLNFGCYAIRAGGQTILVDTGWGPDQNGKLIDALATAGIGADTIDVVVFTHLHGDHIGGNLLLEGGAAKPRFPRARFLVPEADWRYYSSQAEPPNLFTEQIVPLEQLGVMDLVSGDYAITPAVTTLATPGHTPGHICIAVASGGERALVLGDVSLSPVDAAEPDWANSFDTDNDQARATRHAVLDRLERERTVVAASHYPKPGLGRLARVDGRRVWQPMNG